MAELLFSRTSAALAATAIALMACARAAPELPPQNLSGVENRKRAAASLTPEERQLSCAGIRQEKKKIAVEQDRLEATIKGNRQYNQAAGYTTSLLFPPAALVVSKHNKAEKDRLDELQTRKDRLTIVSQVKGCR